MAKTFGWSLDYIRNEVAYSDIQMLITEWNKEKKKEEAEQKKNARKQARRGRRRK